MQIPWFSLSSVLLTFFVNEIYFSLSEVVNMSFVCRSFFLNNKMRVVVEQIIKHYENAMRIFIIEIAI